MNPSTRSALRNRSWEAASLAVALAGVDALILTEHLGPGAWALALVAAFLGPVPEGGIFERRALRLTGRLALAVGLGVIFRGVFDLPASVLWFAPLWLGLTAPIDERSLRWARNVPGFVGETLVLGAGVHLVGSLWFERPGPEHIVFLPLLWLALRSILSQRPPPPAVAAERFRIAAILVVALWLLRGFAVRTLHGAGDALWYSMILGDSVEQLRHGNFPIWIGQTPFQFNGAFYPYRLAPAFHTAGALLDLLTGRTLGLFALLNLLLTLAGAAAALGAYLAFASIAPARRWSGFALAILFIACPGVIGIAYNSDLYMTWMTLPFAPWVFWGTVASFDPARRRRALLVLGAVLGATWWGHSPVALWLTVAAAIAQFVRLALDRPVGAALRDSIPAAIAFLAVAAYPVGSVLFFPPEAGGNSTDFQVAVPGNILNFLREVQPAVFQPVSAIGRSLADFQLGYALWIAALALPFALRPLGRSGWTLWSIAAVFLILLNPLPGMDFIWRAVPAFLRDTTGNWVMNRLYLVLALAVVFACAAALARARADGKSGRRWAGVLLGLAVAWSLAEAGKFAHGSAVLRRAEETAESLVLPENVKITRFAYLVLRWPHPFTHGVATPELQNRLRTESGDLVEDDLEAARKSGAVVDSGEIILPAPPGGQPVSAGRQLVLRPGEHYVLEFDFLRPAAESAGTLEVSGPTLQREYGLPEYGGDASFGVGGTHSRLLAISTSSRGLERVTIRFHPAAESRQPGVFARFRLVRYDPAVLPIQVQSWMPFVARVRTADDAWLETPRMFQQNYAADIGGAPVPLRRSPDGLLQVRVPKGEWLVRLRYVAPLGLQGLFWLSFLAGLGLLGALVRWPRLFDTGPKRLQQILRNLLSNASIGKRSRRVGRPATLEAGKWHTHLGRALVVVTVFAVLAVNHRTVADIRPGAWVSKEREADYYNLLAAGFLRGQTSLANDPDPAILALPNPYDPGLRKGLGMHDISFYRGRYFMYFGVTPEVALFTPWKILTGGFLRAEHAPEIFVAIGLLAASGFWLGLRRRYFPDSGLPLLVGGLLAIGLGSMSYAVLRRPSIWEIPISAGYACAMLALYSLYRAVHAGRPAAWYALSGLFLGLAVGARPSYVAAVPVLGAALLLRWFRASATPGKVWQFRLQALAAGLGVGLPALALMAYNYARFDNPAEFGLRYQLSGVDPTKATYFSPGFIGYNILQYFWQPANWGRYFPFIELPDGAPQGPAGYYGVEYVYGLVVTSPFAWLAALAPAAFRRDGDGRLAECVALLALWSGGMALFLMNFNTATARYAVDFVPPIVLLAAIGALGVEAWIGPRWLRVTGGALLAGAGVVSAFIGLMLNYQLLDLFAYHQPEAYTRTAHFFNSISDRLERRVGSPGRGPIEMVVRFPKNRYGTLQPLVTTGHFFQADHFFVVYPNSREIVLGLDHTSRGTTVTEPIPIDYDAPHVIRVAMGSLLPPRPHPAYDRVSPVVADAVTRDLVVWLDGRVVLDRTVEFYPASPESVRIGDEGERKFTGRIESVRRIPVAFAEALDPAFGDILLTLTFPDNRNGSAEPLVSTGRTGAGNLLRVFYVGPGVVRFGYDHWSFAMSESPDIPITPGRHDIRIQLPSLVPPQLPSNLASLRKSLSISIDSTVVWRQGVDSYPSTTGEIAIGRNRIGSSVSGPAFTGKVSSVQILPPGSP